MKLLYRNHHAEDVSLDLGGENGETGCSSCKTHAFLPENNLLFVHVGHHSELALVLYDVVYQYYLVDMVETVLAFDFQVLPVLTIVSDQVFAQILRGSCFHLASRFL